MKIFIDTANIDQIREINALGILDGVTTNPSLVAKEGRPFDEIIRDICEEVDGPISAEVTAVEADEMVKEGKTLARIHDNVVVKIPTISEGLKATKRLSAEGIRVNHTLIFSSSQGMLAAKAGAWLLSPFVGRLDDISHDGMTIVEELREMLDNYDYDAQILVASIRNPLHFVDAARMGADAATVPHQVLMQLIKHPLTDIGLEKFLSDWRKSQR